MSSDTHTYTHNGEWMNETATKRRGKWKKCAQSVCRSWKIEENGDTQKGDRKKNENKKLKRKCDEREKHAHSKRAADNKNM